MDEKFLEFNSQMTEKTNVLKEQERTLLKTIAEVETLKQQSCLHSNLIEACNERIEQIEKKLDVVKMEKLDEKTFNGLRDTVVQTVRSSKAKIEDVNSKIDATDNYLARYLPFNSFCQSIEIAKTISQDQIKTKK